MNAIHKYHNIVLHIVIYSILILSHSIILLPQQSVPSISETKQKQTQSISINQKINNLLLKYRTNKQQPLQQSPYIVNDAIINHPLPKILLVNQIFILQGQVNENKILALISTGKLINKSHFNLYIISKNVHTGQKIIHQQSISIKSKKFGFKQQINYDVVGEYQLSIYVQEYINSINNNNNNQNKIITVVNQSGFISQLKQIKILSKPRIKPIGLQLSVQDNQLYIKWVKQSTLTKLTISQNNNSISKTFIISNIISNEKAQFKIPYHQFINFTQTQTLLQISHAQSLYITANYRHTQYTNPISKSFNVTQHQFMDRDTTMLQIGGINGNTNTKLKNKIDVDEYFSIQGFCKQQIMRNVLVTSPFKQINQIPLNISNQVNVLGKIISAYTKFNINFSSQHQGVYILEVNHKQGFAVLNIPIYIGNKYPLLPDQVDRDENHSYLSNKQTNKISIEQILQDINQIRQSFNRAPVYLNSTLSQLALAHSTDMINRNFTSHINRNNQTPKMRAQKTGIYSNLFGQNIIVERLPYLLQYKLNRSPMHLRNTIDSDWTRVGIGLVKSQKGDYYLTQVFANEEPKITEQQLEQIRNKVITACNSKNQDNIEQNINLSKQLKRWFNNRTLSQNNKNLNQLLTIFQIKTASVLTINLPAGSNYLQEIRNNQSIKKMGKNKFGIAIKYEKGNIKLLGLFY